MQIENPICYSHTEHVGNFLRGFNMKRILMLAFGFFIMGFCNISAMKELNFNIAIRNTAVRTGISIPIRVSYTARSNNNKSVVIATGQTLIVTRLSDIKPGSTIKIEGYGEAIEKLSYSVDVPYNALLNEFNRYAKNREDTLLIDISMGGSAVWANLEAKYEAGLFAPQAVETSITGVYNLLTLFPGVKSHKIHLKTDEDQFLLATRPEAIVHGTDNLKAKDLARYILNLPEKYTYDDVAAAYERGLEDWNPEVVKNQPERKKYLEKVVKVLVHARDILLDTLKK